MLLDTHVLVWWASSPERIPARTRRRLEQAAKVDRPLRVSAISAWEIAMLVERGRLELTMDLVSWMAAVEALPSIEFVPVNSQIALSAVRLRNFPHADPADRMIVATALGLGAVLVTADARLRSYRHARTLWG